MLKTLIKVLLLTGIIIGGYLYLTREKVVPTIDLPAVEYSAHGDNPSDPGEIEIINEPVESEENDSEAEEEVPLPDTELSSEPATTATSEGALPVTYNLAVPFTSQAPQGNWALPYQEACEEASIYMVAEYYQGTPAGKIDPAVADAALLKIVDFENTFLGNYLDTTASETASIVDSYYGYNARVIENPTVDDIKRQIAAGRPVILPAAGRELGNPNFSGLGPLYHMLVIKGYTEDQFIANDPGTRNGENYGYDYEVIMEAMGDWNGGDPAHGAKRILVITPE
jgi:hypothetical protein